MTASSLPFPGMPYGAAPAWCLPVTALSIYGLMLLCVDHARRAGSRALAYLLGGLAFGLSLEFFEVLSGSYTYGHFWTMLGRAPLDVPLCIGCGWATILYTSRLFSDAEALPLVAAAAFDTLLALNIDLSMDAVAYRLHMWHWYWDVPRQNPLTAQWFGIPYGNFIGWITVVFCYSACSRMFEGWLLKREKALGLRVALIAFRAIVCALGVLVLTELVAFPILVKYLGLTSGRRLILFTFVLFGLTIFGWRRRQPAPLVLAPIARWVASWFHVFFVFCFFALGIYTENPWMTAAACINWTRRHCDSRLSRQTSGERGGRIGRAQPGLNCERDRKPNSRSDQRANSVLSLPRRLSAQCKLCTLAQKQDGRRILSPPPPSDSPNRICEHASR